jgi:hypothetical protein
VHKKHTPNYSVIKVYRRNIDRNKTFSSCISYFPAQGCEGRSVRITNCNSFRKRATFMLFISMGEIMSLNCGHQRACGSCRRWYMSMEWWWNDTDSQNRRTQRKTCLSANLSTTNPRWTDAGANPGLRRERPLTYGSKCDVTYIYELLTDSP